MRPKKQLETSSYSLTTTLQSIQDGSSKLSELFEQEMFQELQALLLSGTLTKGGGTYSASDGQNSYMINFFVDHGDIYLDISVRRGHGQLELTTKVAIMKAKSCFSKRVTWLSRHPYSLSMVVLILFILVLVSGASLTSVLRSEQRVGNFGLTQELVSTITHPNPEFTWTD